MNASAQLEPALVASLPMYDLPELADATDALWAAIAAGLQAHGVAAPLELTRDPSPLEDAWRDPRMLFSQTCGLPLMTMLRDEVSLIATPAYSAPGCEGPFHRSAVIVHAANEALGLGGLRGGRCAINQPTSNTGMNLLRAEISELAGGGPFFEEVVVTGSHAESIRAVAEDRADVAAVDAVTLALLQRHRPQLTDAVRVLTWTVRTPGLPLITSAAQPAWTKLVWAQVLGEVAQDPKLGAVLASLLITDFVALPRTHYHAILYFADVARRNGYPRLC